MTMDDIGSVAEIEKWAKEEGSEVHYLELQSQFRCNGSDGYLAWIDDVLRSPGKVCTFSGRIST